MNLILASQSLARKKILESQGYTFSVVPSHIVESFDSQKTIEENAVLLATQKAEEIWHQLSPREKKDTIVIGVDTIIVSPLGTLLEKPKDESDAEAMFRERSGKKELLISGIALVSEKGTKEGFEASLLFWEGFSEQDIQSILQNKEWKGKCGGVMIEGEMGKFCQFEGNKENIMGFPLQTFKKILSEIISS
jgi:septum formation protein